MFGEITGEVKDSTGALIPSVAVTATNAGTNAQRSRVSYDAGIYSFPSLAPGGYNVRAEKAGFKAYTAKVDVQVQQTVRLDLDMAVGSLSETVEVSGTVQLLTTENATLGHVVENKRIVELPLNDRNYLQLVSLAPNTSTGFPSAGQARSRQGGFRSENSISVGGQRSAFNHYSLDGVENTDPNFNTFVIQPSIDALQEFKVQTGVYPAEFGRATTQINVLTKSGTNQFHGTAFEFLSNEKLDAKNCAFRTARPPKDPFKWNQYGGTFSGPVIIPKLFNGKDKLFFMGNYEAFRQRRSDAVSLCASQRAVTLAHLPQASSIPRLGRARAPRSVTTSSIRTAIYSREARSALRSMPPDKLRPPPMAMPSPTFCWAKFAVRKQPWRSAARSSARTLSISMLMHWNGGARTLHAAPVRLAEEAVLD